MNFLGPIAMTTWTYAALGAAALALLAYVIKMRRRRFEVPFAKLWERVLDQKDSNALWKQLKRLISLLLMLLILGLLFFAVLDPTLGGVNRSARNVVVLIDASASMRATDGSSVDATTDAAAPTTSTSVTRFDTAKAKAQALIDSMGGGDVAMILRVDGQATPLSRFSSDAPMLRNVVAKLTPSDTPADLPRALAAAADALAGRPNPLIVVISDGAFPVTQLERITFGPIQAAAAPDAAAGSGSASGSGAAANATVTKSLATLDLSGIDVRYLPVGHRSDNVGIIAFNVRRYVANKAAYEVFIEVQNFGSAPVKRRLTLLNDTTPVEVRELSLAPGQKLREVYRELPGGEGNRLRAVINVGEGAAADPFPLDDEAFALLPARKQQKVLLVTADNLYLEGAILVYDNIVTDKVSPAEYAANPNVAADYATVIFDDVTPDVLPPPPTALMFFHPTGAHSPVTVARQVLRPHITDTDENHPVMRWVTMSDVNFDSSAVFAPDPSRGEIALATAVRDPIVVAKRSAGQKMLLFGFSLPAPGRDAATDLVLRVAFPLLLVNALDWFAGDDADLLTTYVTGRIQRVALDGAIGLNAVEITAPDGTALVAPVMDGLASFYAPHVGFYQLMLRDPNGVAATAAAAPAPVLALAANLASASESDIAPSAELKLGQQTLQAPEAFAATRSQKLWIYFIMFAGLLMAVEWITYHRRITV
ncbi:MAG: VWA domain-containing protein [Kofleriaceae bacterium]|nr:VWA domain-containing protein [Kofleriaceae bacterium]